MHRAPAEGRELPDYLIPLGRTIGIGANGAVSNLSASPNGGVARVRRELRRGGYDVIHIHEPLVPLIGWNAALGARAPVVGTFHAYSTKALSNHVASALGARRVFNRLSARIAVSEAAAWTGRRWFGGHYEIVPNGVDVGAAPGGRSRRARSCVSPSSAARGAQGVARPADRVRSADRACTEPPHGDRRGARGRAPLSRRPGGDRLDRRAWPRLPRGAVDTLHDADLLCAPSLSGESFGMVLTEAFAAGTPAIASAIAGYSDVVTDGLDGVLVPPATHSGWPRSCSAHTTSLSGWRR